MQPILERLSDLKAGDRGRIVFLTPLANGNATRLASLGLTPGIPIVLLQNSDCLILQAGGSDIALDRAVAGDVFVSLTPSDG